MNELSIIVPVVYQADRLEGLLARIASYLMSNPSEIDLIVVANSSVLDAGRFSAGVRSAYPWMKFSLLQINGGTRSYGALCRFGIAYSQSRYAVLVSAHGDDDIGVIPSMLAKMRSGSQVAQAVRFADPADAASVSLRFRIYQFIYRSLTRFALGLRISDSTYSLKMFDRVFLQALGLTQNGFSICPEITFKALLAGGTVSSIPTSFKAAPLSRDFKLYKEGIGYLWLLWRGFMHRLGVLWF